MTRVDVVFGTHNAADGAFRRCFEEDVAAAKRVRGLHTVPVVDADVHAAEPWLVTAYVPGPTLHDTITAEGPLPVDAALRLTATVAEAVQSIHAADVIHGDLKPTNVLLTAGGPKVVDFGIARVTDVTSVADTGTMADVFALGLLAHFAATGHPAVGSGPTPPSGKNPGDVTHLSIRTQRDTHVAAFARGSATTGFAALRPGDAATAESTSTHRTTTALQVGPAPTPRPASPAPRKEESTMRRRHSRRHDQPATGHSSVPGAATRARASHPAPAMACDAVGGKESPHE